MRVLAESCSLSSLAEAVAFLADDPGTSPEELLPALRHPGIVAEQAAILDKELPEPPRVDGPSRSLAPPALEAPGATPAATEKG